jgi:hypothetical protein
MVSAILFENRDHQKTLEMAMVESVFETFLLIIISLVEKSIAQTKGSLG